MRLVLSFSTHHFYASTMYESCTCTVSRNNCKRSSRIGTWPGTLKNPTKCLWRGSPIICPTSSVRLYMCRHMYNWNIVECGVEQPIHTPSNPPPPHTHTHTFIVSCNVLNLDFVWRSLTSKSSSSFCTEVIQNHSFTSQVEMTLVGQMTERLYHIFALIWLWSN